MLSQYVVPGEGIDFVIGLVHIHVGAQLAVMLSASARRK